MKFQLKALVAALALVAAVPAQATLDVPADQITGIGNSSMVLGVFDRANNVSALFDLGKNYSDFNQIGNSFADSNVDAAGTSFSWDLTTGDYSVAWNTFLNLVNPANLQWAVVGADNVGNGATARGMIMTLNQPTVTALATQPVIGQAGTLQNYFSEAQATSVQVYENHTLVANGANVANAGILPNFVNYFGSGRANSAGSVVVGNIDQSLSVFQQVTGTGTIQPSSSIIFANGANFLLSSNGQLNYSTIAAVPEADTWAMMLLGLGFMGFVARRKQA